RQMSPSYDLVHMILRSRQPTLIYGGDDLPTLVPALLQRHGQTATPWVFRDSGAANAGRDLRRGLVDRWHAHPLLVLELRERVTACERAVLVEAVRRTVHLGPVDIERFSGGHLLIALTPAPVVDLGLSSLFALRVPAARLLPT